MYLTYLNSIEKYRKDCEDYCKRLVKVPNENNKNIKKEKKHERIK